MTTNPPSPSDAEISRLAFRPDGAAKSLSISERTLYSWTKAGLIAHVKVGKIIRYPVSALRKCLHQMAMGTLTQKPLQPVAQCRQSDSPAVGVVKLSYSPKEAAEAIGISARKLWELTNTNQVPHVRIGRLVKYPVRELQEWLAKGGQIGS